MKTLLLSAAILLASITSATAETTAISEEKEVIIRKMMDQTGYTGAAAGKQIAEVFIVEVSQALKTGNSKIDPKAIQILGEEVKTITSNEALVYEPMVQKLIPVYAELFTIEELKQITEFYDSPAGKKFITELPTLSQAGMEASQEVSFELLPILIDRVRTRYEEEGIRMQ